MSFNDLERGLPLSSSSSPLPDAFNQLRNRLSIQLFKINGNVQAISRLVDGIGSPREQRGTRDELHNLLEVTRDLVKTSSADLKELAAWGDGQPQPELIKRSQKKYRDDFQLALNAFQRVQKEAVERTRIAADRALAASPPQNTSEPYTDEPRSPAAAAQQLQQQVHAPNVSEAEITYQEGLIEERDAEIREIETGIHELNEIFRDLGTLVVEQGGMLDNIESNVNYIASDTRGAAEELDSAHDYQRKAGKRALCLLLILIVVILIVLLAVLS